MRKITGILLALLSFCVGLIVGAIFSPVNGIGNNNGNTYYCGKGKKM